MVKEMKPVIFKKGLGCGKVEGIRGLYKDPYGRWYVRKSFEGIDRQLTLENLNENPTFSELERKAAQGLRRLEKSMEKQAGTCKKAHPVKSTLDKAKDRCVQYLDVDYKQRGVSHAVWLRRKTELAGFAFASKPLVEIDDHNLALLREKLDSATPKSAIDLYLHIKAVFSLAIQDGKHFGANPCARVLKPAKLTDKDVRYISVAESAKVFAHMDLMSDVYGEEIACFFYLLTLGMRATSAILFDAEDLKPCADGYYYRVINHKTRRTMDFMQLIPAHMGERLKALGRFTKSLKDLLDKTNKIIVDVLHRDVSQKHLRKGFLTECINAGGFSVESVELITHTTKDIVQRHYNAKTQESIDQIMRWWNAAFWQAVEAAEPLDLSE